MGFWTVVVLAARDFLWLKYGQMDRILLFLMWQLFQNQLRLLGLLANCLEVNLGNRGLALMCAKGTGLFYVS